MFIFVLKIVVFKWKLRVVFLHYQYPGNYLGNMEKHLTRAILKGESFYVLWVNFNLKFNLGAFLEQLLISNSFPNLKKKMLTQFWLLKQKYTPTEFQEFKVKLIIWITTIFAAYLILLSEATKVSLLPVNPWNWAEDF